MGSPSDEKKMIRETLLGTPNPRGGFQTLPFIIGGNCFIQINAVIYMLDDDVGVDDDSK